MLRMFRLSKSYSLTTVDKASFITSFIYYYKKVRISKRSLFPVGLPRKHMTKSIGRFPF